MSKRSDAALEWGRVTKAATHSRLAQLLMSPAAGGADSQASGTYQDAQPYSPASMRVMPPQQFAAAAAETVPDDSVMPDVMPASAPSPAAPLAPPAPPDVASAGAPPPAAPVASPTEARHPGVIAEAVPGKAQGELAKIDPKHRAGDVYWLAVHGASEEQLDLETRIETEVRWSQRLTAIGIQPHQPIPITPPRRPTDIHHTSMAHPPTHLPITVTVTFTTTTALSNHPSIHQPTHRPQTRATEHSTRLNQPPHDPTTHPETHSFTFMLSHWSDQVWDTVLHHLTIPKVQRLLTVFDGDVNGICENLKWKFFTGQTLWSSNAVSVGPSTVTLPAGMTQKFFDEQTTYFEELKKNNFEFQVQGNKGNPAGGRWQRYINNPKNATAKKEYVELGNNKNLQREFRAKWARMEYEKFQHSTTQTTTYKD